MSNLKKRQGNGKLAEAVPALEPCLDILPQIRMPVYLFMSFSLHQEVPCLLSLFPVRLPLFSHLPSFFPLKKKKRKYSLFQPFPATVLGLLLKYYRQMGAMYAHNVLTHPTTSFVYRISKIGTTKGS